jgi:hypothetical protein
MSDHRKFIRHPAEVPIEFNITGQEPEQALSTRNVSIGGLCFQATNPVALNTEISIRMPSINSGVVLTGRVVWCSEKEGYFDIGVEFHNKTDAIMAKTLEEICYIQKFEKNHPKK